MIDLESGGRPRVIGDGGDSVGLLQLHKNGLGRGMSVEQRMDPEQNLRRGIDYHARYLAQYSGIDYHAPYSEALCAAIAAHNAGGLAINAEYQDGRDWRTAVHHRRADGSIVTVRDIYVDPILKTARERHGYQG